MGKLCHEHEGVPRPAEGAHATSGRGPSTGSVDPLIGQIIAGRYAVERLLNNGGMGRVYRARQLSLDRRVAVKVIHEHLLDVEHVADRFLTEALAVSRLNHPNVVSVFDFGQLRPPGGTGLFLVMELLEGADLAALIEEAPIPPQRAAHILVQVLAALSEAHQLGIVHRDIKPANIVLESRRGADFVKVIDFGVARLTAEASRTLAGSPTATPRSTGLEAAMTLAGSLLGTPRYMAPEQVRGCPVTAAADIYATGIVLFEMLTGKPPFDAGSPAELFGKHLLDPRPDPRAVAPERDIPAALAEACLRAMAINPEDRFPDAESFALAIEWLVPGRRSPSSPMLGPGTPPSIDAPTSPSAGDLPRLHRAAELVWITGQLADPEVVAVAVHGRSGSGRSWLLRNAAADALRSDFHVISPRLPDPPRWEIGYGALRRVIASLAALPLSDHGLVSGARAVVDEQAAAGLRVVFGGEVELDPSGGQARFLAMHAFAWAVRRALYASSGRPVLLVLDDADTMDGASIAALSELVRHVRSDRFRLLVSSEAPPDGALSPRVRALQLSGLGRSQAAASLRHEPIACGALERLDDDIEPLYVDQLRRWVASEGTATAPPTLFGLVERRILQLSPDERRALQWIAVTGGVDPAMISPPVPQAALAKLVRAGFVDVEPGALPAVRQRLFRRVALATAPLAALHGIHAKVADMLEDTSAPIGLRAYHAVRGRPGFEAFLLVEEVARLRASRGDPEGAITALAMGLNAARRLELRGDAPSAQSARRVFGRKLAERLRESGRFAEAIGVLEETLGLVGEGDVERAHLLSQLTHAAACAGRYGRAEQARREALHVAERHGEAHLSRLLSEPLLATASPPAPPLLFSPPYLATGRTLAAAGKAARRPVDRPRSGDGSRRLDFPTTPIRRN